MEPPGCAVGEPLGSADVDPPGCAVVGPTGGAVVEPPGCAVGEPLGSADVEPTGCELGGSVGMSRRGAAGTGRRACRGAVIEPLGCESWSPRDACGLRECGRTLHVGRWLPTGREGARPVKP